MKKNKGNKESGNNRKKYIVIHLHQFIQSPLQNYQKEIRLQFCLYSFHISNLIYIWLDGLSWSLDLGLFAVHNYKGETRQLVRK